LIKRGLAKLKTLINDDNFKKDVTQDFQLIVVALIGIALLFLFASMGGAGGDIQKRKFKPRPRINEWEVR
jgi:hypothetical protein